MCSRSHGLLSIWNSRRIDDDISQAHLKESFEKCLWFEERFNPERAEFATNA
jgi:hypothetical protein